MKFRLKKKETLSYLCENVNDPFKKDIFQKRNTEDYVISQGRLFLFSLVFLNMNKGYTKTYFISAFLLHH